MFHIFGLYWSNGLGEEKRVVNNGQTKNAECIGILKAHQCFGSGELGDTQWQDNGAKNDKMGLGKHMIGLLYLYLCEVY